MKFGLIEKCVNLEVMRGYFAGADLPGGLDGAAHCLNGQLVVRRFRPIERLAPQSLAQRRKMLHLKRLDLLSDLAVMHNRGK